MEPNQNVEKAPMWLWVIFIVLFLAVIGFFTWASIDKQTTETLASEALTVESAAVDATIDTSAVITPEITPSDAAATE